MPAMNSPAALPLAALVHPDDEHAMELLLERVARRLQPPGWRLGGVVHRHDRDANGNKRILLFVLRSDRHFARAPAVGGATRACSLTPPARPQAGAVLRVGLDDGVDLVVINRFGIVEASGQGFAAEFAAFVEAGTPVLTAVAARHLEDWRRYTGGLHAELAADETLIEAWCRQHLSRTDTCTP
jgi:hypothetical protein